MASFAYLDPSRTLLEMSLEALGGFAPIFSDQAPLIQSVPCDLDESWKSFEQELGNFKLKLKKANKDLTMKMSQLDEINKNIKISKMITEHITNDDLKAKLLSVVDNHESEEGISALTLQCGELKGKVEAMKKVLVETNAERYAKFTCFVCMERLVDLFIDPCGHVVCDYCWLPTRDKKHCPACRGNITGVKKMFAM